MRLKGRSRQASKWLPAHSGRPSREKAPCISRKDYMREELAGLGAVGYLLQFFPFQNICEALVGNLENLQFPDLHWWAGDLRVRFAAIQVFQTDVSFQILQAKDACFQSPVIINCLGLLLSGGKASVTNSGAISIDGNFPFQSPSNEIHPSTLVPWPLRLDLFGSIVPFLAVIRIPGSLLSWSRAGTGGAATKFAVKWDPFHSGAAAL